MIFGYCLLISANLRIQNAVFQNLTLLIYSITDRANKYNKSLSETWSYSFGNVGITYGTGEIEGTIA